MPKGFQPGNKLAGSRKGIQNKLTSDIKEAIQKAFSELGGYIWLVKLGQEKPEAFATLLAKILPKDVNLQSGEGGPLQIIIRGYNGNQTTNTGTKELSS